MLDAEKLFLNILVLFSASAYWFVTGHLLPAILGYIILFLYFFDTTFAFVDLLLSIVILCVIIYFFAIDYLYKDDSSNFAQFGFSTIYMLVIFFKAKSIFDSE